MEEHIKVDISIYPKPEIANLVKIFNKYLISRAKAENPDTNTYDEECDFIQKKSNDLQIQ